LIPPGSAAFPVTDAARGYLSALTRADTLFFYSPDGEDHYPKGLIYDWQRGQGVSTSPHMVAAHSPPSSLTAYHRSLGLGPARVICPRNFGYTPVAEALLQDTRLLEEIRADDSLRGICFAYKDRRSEWLAERLALEPVCCAPPAATYEALNDKWNLAAAGKTHGFSTLPTHLVVDLDSLERVFRLLNGIYEKGCILRLRRGTCGSNLCHARTGAEARNAWKRLSAQGGVIMTPFVPPERIIRNLALHGLSTPDGFQPLVLTDQIIRRSKYRGGRSVHEMEPGDWGAVHSCLPGLGSWLQTEGYVDAPAGVDGFLIDTPEGRQFVIIDPNIRMTGSLRPWAVSTTLGERAGRAFAWQSEWFAFFGPALTIGDLRRKLADSLLDPDHPDRGGILPSCMVPFGFRPFGMLLIEVILLGRDTEHLRHLRKRVLGIGLTPRIFRE
jgi:hypothetical protein